MPLLVLLTKNNLTKRYGANLLTYGGKKLAPHLRIKQREVNID